MHPRGLNRSVGSGDPRTDDRRIGGPRIEDAAGTWVDWLRGVKWDWFATLTFGAAANGASPEHARASTAEWMTALRAKNPRAYAVVAVEQGAHLGGWHTHVLLGGVGAHPRLEAELRSAWRARGPVHVVRYDPSKDLRDNLRSGAVPYLMKEWPESQLEIVGTLRRWRQRVPRLRSDEPTSPI